MVNLTTWLCRVPVIRFKKGGLGRPSAAPAAGAAAAAGAPSSCPVGASKPGDLHSTDQKGEPKMLGMIKIPKGVLITSGKGGQEVVNLNIILQKQEAKR